MTRPKAVAAATGSSPPQKTRQPAPNSVTENVTALPGSRREASQFAELRILFGRPTRVL